MSKYDFEIDLSENTSTGMILSKISKGSTVLEFGCAAGRMTRYMKETLGCRVYIVEYDREAYAKALEYAEDGLCDDILQFRWVEKFNGMKFDAILFADVLEHLTSPEKVLSCAAKLLKDTGCLYASIPNITHNDILLKACEEHFDYTSTGLLDDTHVHFWGLKNIEALSDRCGLSIRQIEGTYCPTGCTEQYAQSGGQERVLLKNILKERQCGEIYQFIVTFDKGHRDGAAHIFRKPSIQSCIYLDTGADFNENEKIPFWSEYSGQGSYLAHYVIPQPEKIKRVRFDPIELQGCILRHISIVQGEETLPLVYANGIGLEEGILLLGKDPMVYTDVLPKGGPIVIDADIILLGEQYISFLQDTCVNQHAAANRLHGEIAGLARRERELLGEIGNLSQENENFRADLKGKRAEIEGLRQDVGRFQAEEEILRDRLAESAAEERVLRDRIAGLTTTEKELRQTIANAAQENAELRTDLGAYIILADNKDKYALALEQELNRYQNLWVVKGCNFVIRILRGVKRRLKRVIRRGEQS